jgi:tripartite ATP-independent transporter DctM subunit
LGIAELSLLLLVGILVLLALGVPLGLASGFLGACVAYWKLGERGLFILGQRMYDLTIEHALIAVPLFIFMAMLLERSNIAKDMYDSLNVWLSRTRGGIAIVTAIMAIIMAAMSGIIGGEVVLLGLIALPQMLRLKYDQNLAVGTICASGSLGTMIPPSIVLIIYGVVTETSIHALFKAAIVPGLMLGGLYIVYIIVRTRLNPSLAPLPEMEVTVTILDKIKALKGLVPPLLIVVMILGSIYGGITGITEAAAMGVTGVLALIAIRGEFSGGLLLDALQRTMRATGTILWVTFGATALAGAYSIAGGPTYVAGSITGMDLPPIGVVMMMMLIFLIMGAFMDWVGIVLLAMPVFLPLVVKLGYDPVWFGILFCVNMQVSFLSPPFGPAAFYLKSVAPPQVSLTDIFRGFLPFICIQLVVLALILFFPQITHVFL